MTFLSWIAFFGLRMTNDVNFVFLLDRMKNKTEFVLKRKVCLQQRGTIFSNQARKQHFVSF
jgi:hypothetical protein